MQKKSFFVLFALAYLHISDVVAEIKVSSSVNGTVPFNLGLTI